MAAITKQVDWSQVNSSLCTQYFANARLATARDSGLTMVPIHQHEESDQKGFSGKKDRGNEGMEETSSSGFRPEKQTIKGHKMEALPLPI